MKNVLERFFRVAWAPDAGGAAAAAGAGAGGAAAPAATAAATAGIGALAGGAPASAAGASATPAAGAPPAPAGDAWFKDLNPEYHSAITAKGWDKLQGGDVTKALADSYFNLEKLLGADKAGNALIPPKPDAPKDVKDAFYAKLGRPESPDGYEIKLPDGVDPALSKGAAAKFHELGLTKEQGATIAQWYQEQEVAQAKAWADRSTQEVGEWSKAQGDKLEANMEAARRATRALGFGENDPKLNAFERAFGTKGMLDLFAKIGSSMLEAPAPGATSSTPAIGGLTPELAKSRIATLQNDPAFQAKLLSPNVKVREPAVAEWDAAFKAAYPS